MHLMQMPLAKLLPKPFNLYTLIHKDSAGAIHLPTLHVRAHWLPKKKLRSCDACI